ncbi:MAG TPA: hypothetical protein VJL34_01620 [Anaerolineales bacterium]|nr:hypothetical protein [Anaerolineales bacterium]
MEQKASRGKEPRKRGLTGTLQLIGVEGQQAPEMAVYALDRGRVMIYRANVDIEGKFDLPDEVLKKAAYVAIGPDTDKFDELDKNTLMMYRTRRFVQQMEISPVLEIPRPDWSRWLFVTLCVSGSVSHCYPWPWLLNDMVSQVVLYKASSVQFIQLEPTVKSALSDIAMAKSASILSRLQRCETVCDGVVEVYRRTCCCDLDIDLEPRLPEIIDILEHLVERIPIKWPPIPEPDPPPWLENYFFKSGAMDEMALNAPRDLAALRSMPPTERIAYVQARPYLIHWVCSCSLPVKVAQGNIRSDGRFSICWREPLRLMLFNCYDEYAYKVKQNIGGATVTIYDGVAANKWFDYDDDASLVSHHLLAQGCRHNEFPGEGAFVLLQDIGLTESHRLQTPDATGWDRVAAPGYNDGLVDPVPTAMDARGLYKNRNWGGTLYLRYHFSEAMKSLGARYYRISVSAANASGNPTGTRYYYSDGLSWKKYVPSGTDILVETQVMGPFSVGGEDNLYEIAYDADADWQSGQYHGNVNTADGTKYTNGRYLITLEVFNASGQRIRPTGAGGAGVDAAFTFRRWYQPVGPTAEVPYAALTHMFWWDNRQAITQILDLRMNGAPSAAQCQFMEGPGSTTFSVGYKAYHPEPMFLLNHSLWWRRGLGGPTGYLVNTSPDNAGPALTVSPTDTFSDMLGLETRCSFTLNLYANVKTTNGIGTLDSLDGWDYASFALLLT